MKHPRNNKKIDFARKLRKEMTKEERHLWYDFLKDYPVRFRRQEIIDSFIVDFYCDKARLAVELDGSQHYEEEKEIYDEERTKRLSELGINVIRFSNSDVLRNFEGVCERIGETVEKAIHPSAAHGGSSPQGEP
ncbi:MAG: endonuclease domain-containing protein [Bacillota bacterium]|nr:endonuclease domain-containing protein [Bacillota bacterium]